MNHDDDDFVFVCFCAARVRQVRHTQTHTLSLAARSHMRAVSHVCAPDVEISYSKAVLDQSHTHAIFQICFPLISLILLHICLNKAKVVRGKEIFILLKIKCVDLMKANSYL
jgi:hypothetical protein